MLDLLVPLGSVVCALAIYLLVTRPALRRAKHQRTLKHIRELEIANGIQPSDYWSGPDSFEFEERWVDTGAQHGYQPQTVIIQRNPYSFSREKAKPSRPLVEVNHGGLGVRLEDIPPGQLPPK